MKHILRDNSNQFELKPNALRLQSLIKPYFHNQNSIVAFMLHIDHLQSQCKTSVQTVLECDAKRVQENFNRFMFAHCKNQNQFESDSLDFFV